MDKILLDKLKSFAGQRPEIHTVLVYGSFAKNRKRPSSDIDIALLLKDKIKNHIDYKINISRELDTVLNYETDVLILNFASPHIAFRAIKEGKIAFQNQEKSLWNQFVVKTISMNEDMEILYRKVRHG